MLPIWTSLSLVVSGGGSAAVDPGRSPSAAAVPASVSPLTNSRRFQFSRPSLIEPSSVRQEVGRAKNGPSVLPGNSRGTENPLPTPSVVARGLNLSSRGAHNARGEQPMRAPASQRSAPLRSSTAECSRRGGSCCSGTHASCGRIVRCTSHGHELMVGTFRNVVPGAHQRLEFREGRIHLLGHGTLLGLFADDLGR